MFGLFSFSPTNNCLVSGSKGGELRFWDISSGNFEPIGKGIYGHFSHSAPSVAFSPDGLLVASGSHDGSVKIWSAPPMSNQPPAAGQDITDKAPYEPSSLDRRGRPVFSNGSFINEDGWMCDSRREDQRRLFWVPKENRGGFWWPRNTAVIHRTVTKFDFSHFAHGENWTGCRSDFV